MIFWTAWSCISTHVTNSPVNLRGAGSAASLLIIFQYLFNTLFASLHSLFIYLYYVKPLLCVTLNSGFLQNSKQNFHFLCQFHSPRMSGLTHPQGKPENVWEIIIYFNFNFLFKYKQKINQIFGCGGSFPYDIVAKIFESKTLGRVAASNSKMTKNRFQGGEGRRSVLIMRHHQVLLVYQLTHFFS